MLSLWIKSYCFRKKEKPRGYANFQESQSYFLFIDVITEFTDMNLIFCFVLFCFVEMKSYYGLSSRLLNILY